jgi:taurine dioxygenase
MPYEFLSSRDEPSFGTIEATPVAGAIGAEISGVDLSQPLPEQTREEIYQAFLHYLVIFFRDQQLTPAQHTEFARMFGEVQMGGTIPRLEEQPEVKKQEYTMQNQVSGDVNMHADDTFVEIPSKCSILYGLKMPPAGGDTIWVNCQAAYAALSRPMKEFLQPLSAVHDLSANFGNIAPGFEDPEMKLRIHKKYPPVQHPVIRSHPETGLKSIFVNEMVTSHIVGLDPDESAAVLTFLIDHLKKQQFQFRLHWTDGTVVVWDNRATEHMVIPDFQPAYRLNHRVAIKDTARPV